MVCRLREGWANGGSRSPSFCGSGIGTERTNYERVSLDRCATRITKSGRWQRRIPDEDHGHRTGILWRFVWVHLSDLEEYLLVFGNGQLQAAKALGCMHIPAIIRDFDPLHAELARIDENLIRQELPVLDRAEQLRRRKAIYEALHPETRGQAGPGRGHHEKRRKDFAPFAEEMAAQMGCAPRAIQQDVQIAMQLGEPVKAAIRPFPIANRKADLLRLSRLPPEGQAAIVQTLTSGRVMTFEGARRALAAKKPATPQAPETQTPGVTTGDWPLNGHDRHTLPSLLVGRLKEVAVIANGQIGGLPAAMVLAARLAAMPWPELALLAGWLTGTPEEAAAAWMTAVCGDTDADAAIVEDDAGDGSLADGPKAAPPVDEDQSLPSPSLPWPAPSLDGVTPPTQRPDEGEGTSAHTDETCTGGAAQMLSSISHARGPAAGTEVFHVESREKTRQRRVPSSR